MPFPVKNQPYEYSVELADRAGPGKFLANPPIIAGDFKFSLDGSAFANLATLPVVDPSGSTSVKIVWSADEMNGSKCTVIGSQQTGDDWDDIAITVDIPTTTIELQAIEIAALKEGIIFGEAVAGVLAQNQATTNLIGYADNQLIGGVIIVTSGAAEGERADILDYSAATGLIVFSQMVSAMSAGNSFKIV